MKSYLTLAVIFLGLGLGLGQDQSVVVEGESQSSCDGDIRFELITGYVYSLATDIIDSKLKTLKLVDCIQYCRENPQCEAINFETGLCVLFKTSAGENSASLAVSQLPVFTLYAQKVCTPKGQSDQCVQPWAYETVPGMGLNSGYVAAVRSATTRSHCAMQCINETEFNCKSAAFGSSTGECFLSELNRNMAGRRPLLTHDGGFDVMEVVCSSVPKRMCDFRAIPHKILKTVDTIHEGVETIEECKMLCLNSPYFCQSYDYNSTRESICRLSHHSSATLKHIERPYIEVNHSATFELKTCYQIDVECKGQEMLARISTSSLFDGKIYSRNHPYSCVVDASNATYVELSLPYNDLNCQVTQEGEGLFLSNIVIQHHDMIVTSADLGLALHCRYDLKNTTVTNSFLSGMQVKEDLGEEYVRETIVHSPNVTMSITSNGSDVLTAQVGDDLSLLFEIQTPDSPYEIFVRELVAMDGLDQSEVILIDERGCPTDTTIMQAVSQVGSGQVLEAPFQAFKFPSSEVVQFRALVTPCLPRCEPVQCSGVAFDGTFESRLSYGKRRKREISEPGLMLAKSVRITDRFSFEEALTDAIEIDTSSIGISSPAACLSWTTVIICGVLFFLTQVVILVVWSFLWRRKRATKQVGGVGGAVPAEVFFGTLSSRRTDSTAYLTH